MIILFIIMGQSLAACIQYMYTEYIKSDVDTNPQINGKIIDDYTIEYETLISSYSQSFKLIPLCKLNNDTIKINLNFDANCRNNTDHNEKIGKILIIFSIPISELNIKETNMNENTTTLTINLKTKYDYSMYHIITGVKKYGKITNLSMHTTHGNCMATMRIGIS